MKVYIRNLDIVCEANKGDNLLRLLQKNNIAVQSVCGGNGICKKCKVFDCQKNIYVLSCQTSVEHDMTIEVDVQQKEWKETFTIQTKPEKASGRTGMSGIVMDIGTTTLAMYLIDLGSGSVIDKFSCLNPQRKYGADVISRIMHCHNYGTEELQVCLTKVVSKVIADFKKKHNLAIIDKLYVSGNTTMLHIFLNINPENMGYHPYTPVFLEQREVNGTSLGLDVKQVVVLASISSFIGADVTMGILASEMLQDENALLIDLGTNGEMVLKRGDSLFAASTAAGPAFEGTNIECGSGAMNGAIHRVVYENDEFQVDFIGDSPRTITGSALIDVISILLDLGLIEENGYLMTDDDRFIHQEDRIFIVDKVYLSQKDIRQLQLAKSAIRSGIDVLMRVGGLEYEKIDKVYIAGGFGFYLNPEKAVRIGMLPKAFLDKIAIIGNASASGALMCLLDYEYQVKAQSVSRQVNVVELNTNMLFNELFIDNIAF